MASVIPPTPLGTDAPSGHPAPYATAGPVPGSTAGRRFRFELAAHPGSVARARQLTRARLGVLAVCEDTCETAALVVSELVTNAIVHTAGERVLCELSDTDGVVRIAVRDEGCAPGEPRPVPQRPDEEHGRGLLLVAGLCRAWGVQETGPGLLVWAELEAGRPACAEPPLSAHPSRDLPRSGGRSRTTGGTQARGDLGWGARKPPTVGEGRSDPGWGPRRPPADGRGAGTDALPGVPGRGAQTAAGAG
ncbi:ATP-binding protein [Streptomyces sp. NPDC048664]|uniref:ATP-binding protein n=1 Tax=Streptomyces sp. NPDC048664 TaxID=3154505 RepID=UPI00343716C0